MKLKFCLMALSAMLFSASVQAEETANETTTDETAENSGETENKSGSLRANLKKAALEISSTEVKNAEQYKNSPNSQLSSDSETVTKGIFDFVLEYEQTNYQWNNSLFMEYGKTKLKPVDGPDVTSENADKILLTTDYSRKTWRYWDADVGPFASLAYQTEFEPNDDAPRTKTFRGKTGIKMFNGKYIKELYAAAVGELDLTYHREDTKGAYELGLKAEYPFKDNVKFEVDTYFRDYLTYSAYEATDFEYEFSFISRMLVELYKGCSFGPYIQFLRAQDRGSDKYGSSTIIGVTLAYGGLWDL